MAEPLNLYHKCVADTLEMPKPRLHFHRMQHSHLSIDRQVRTCNANNFGIWLDFLEVVPPSRSFFRFGLVLSVSFVVAARRVKSCFVERKQLPERFKKGKEDHDVFPLPFLSPKSSPSSPLFSLPFLSLLGPVFFSGVDGAACSVVSGACLQFL